MKTRNIMFFTLLIIGIWNLSAQTLTVRIENIDVGKGHVMVGVFNEERNFPDNAPFIGKTEIASDMVIVSTFTNLPVGQYAVAVYQDNNSNGQLDTNIFGIPMEKYGFSNNTRVPNFRRCLFHFNGDMTIAIQIK